MAGTPREARTRDAAGGSAETAEPQVEVTMGVEATLEELEIHTLTQPVPPWAVGLPCHSCQLHPSGTIRLLAMWVEEMQGEWAPRLRLAE